MGNSCKSCKGSDAPVSQPKNIKWSNSPRVRTTIIAFRQKSSIFLACFVYIQRCSNKSPVTKRTAYFRYHVLNAASASVALIKASLNTLNESLSVVY